jgi:hypothetical protein
VGRDAQVLSWPGLLNRSDGGNDLESAPLPEPYGALAEHAVIVRKAVTADLALLEEAVEIVRQDAPALLMLSLGGVRTLQSQFDLVENDLPSPVSAEGHAIRIWLEEIGLALEELDQELGEGLLIVISPSAITPHYAPEDIQSYIRSRLRPHAGDADGFILIEGAGAVERRGAEAVAVTDLVPTLLFSAGLPVARDMDGRVLSEGFDPRFMQKTQLLLIPSYDVRRLEVRP